MNSAVSLCETSPTPPPPLLNWRCNPHLAPVQPLRHQVRRRVNINIPAKCALPLIPFPHKLSSRSSECHLQWDYINCALYGARSPGVEINGQISFSLNTENERSTSGHAQISQTDGDKRGRIQRAWHAPGHIRAFFLAWWTKNKNKIKFKHIFKMKISNSQDRTSWGCLKLGRCYTPNGLSKILSTLFQSLAILVVRAFAFLLQDSSVPSLGWALRPMRQDTPGSLGGHLASNTNINWKQPNSGGNSSNPE